MDWEEWKWSGIQGRFRISKQGKSEFLTETPSRASVTKSKGKKAAMNGVLNSQGGWEKAGERKYHSVSTFQYTQYQHSSVNCAMYPILCLI